MVAEFAFSYCDICLGSSFYKEISILLSSSWKTCNALWSSLWNYGNATVLNFYAIAITLSCMYVQFLPWCMLVTEQMMSTISKP